MGVMRGELFVEVVYGSGRACLGENFAVKYVGEFMREYPWGFECIFCVFFAGLCIFYVFF